MANILAWANARLKWRPIIEWIQFSGNNGKIFIEIVGKIVIYFSLLFNCCMHFSLKATLTVVGKPKLFKREI